MRGAVQLSVDAYEANVRKGSESDLAAGMGGKRTFVERGASASSWTGW